MKERGRERRKEGEKGERERGTRVEENVRTKGLAGHNLETKGGRRKEGIGRGVSKSV